MTYIATFFSHYGAIQFAKKIASYQISSQMMPVPRKVSSSCGTCVQFETEKDVRLFADEDVEKIFRYCNNEYILMSRGNNP